MEPPQHLGQDDKGDSVCMQHPTTTTRPPSPASVSPNHRRSCAARPACGQSAQKTALAECVRYYYCTGPHTSLHPPTRSPPDGLLQPPGEVQTPSTLLLTKPTVQPTTKTAKKKAGRRPVSLQALFPTTTWSTPRCSTDQTAHIDMWSNTPHNILLRCSLSTCQLVRPAACAVPAPITTQRETAANPDSRTRQKHGSCATPAEPWAVKSQPKVERGVETAWQEKGPKCWAASGMTATQGSVAQPPTTNMHGACGSGRVARVPQP